MCSDTRSRDLIWNTMKTIASQYIWAYHNWMENTTMKWIWQWYLRPWLWNQKLKALRRQTCCQNKVESLKLTKWSIKIYQLGLQEATQWWQWEGDRLQGHCWGLLRTRALSVSKVILRRLSWNGRLLSADAGEIDCMIAVEVSWDMMLFQLEELHLEEVLEMADHFVVTLGEDTAWLLLRSARTELFKLEELCLGYCLEMADSWAVTLQRILHGHYSGLFSSN